MSGPWDRPSPDPDADWPVEDAAARPRDPWSQPADAWSSGDLWPAPGSDAGSGWDDWSPTVTPADDPYLEPPAPALSDPWAESWTDDAAAPSTDRSSGDSWADAVPSARSTDGSPGALRDEPVAPPPPFEPWRPDEPIWADVEVVGRDELEEPGAPAADPELATPGEAQTSPPASAAREEATVPSWPAADAPRRDDTPGGDAPSGWGDDVIDADAAPPRTRWGTGADTDAHEVLGLDVPLGPARTYPLDWVPEPSPGPVEEATAAARAPSAEPSPVADEVPPEASVDLQPRGLITDDEAVAADVEPESAGRSWWRALAPWVGGGEREDDAGSTDAEAAGAEPAVEARLGDLAESASMPTEATEAPAPRTAEDAAAARAADRWEAGRVAESDRLATVEPIIDARLDSDEVDAVGDTDDTDDTDATVDGDATGQAIELAPAWADAEAVVAEPESAPDVPEEPATAVRFEPITDAAPAEPRLDDEPATRVEAADPSADESTSPLVIDEEPELEVVPPSFAPSPRAAATESVSAPARGDGEMSMAAEAPEAPSVAGDPLTGTDEISGPHASAAATDEPVPGDERATWPDVPIDEHDEPYHEWATRQPARPAPPTFVAEPPAPAPEASAGRDDAPARIDDDMRSPWATWDDELVAAAPAAQSVEAAPAGAASVEAAPSGAATDDAGRPALESTQVLPTTWEPARPAREAAAALEPEAGDIRTRLGMRERNVEDDEDAEAAPSTAEQAVPWLIGFILLLAGMVIVLLALIFAGDESLGANAPSPSASLLLVGSSGSDAPSASDGAAISSTPPTTSAAPAASTPPTPTSLALPEYGPLEMTYQGRSAALAPIYLLRHDFTTAEAPAVLAQDPSLDVRRFAWEPAGTLGVGLLSDVLVSIEPGQTKRRLGDGISTVTFGDTPDRVYAVRVTQDGTTDTATVLLVEVGSGDSAELARVSYERPAATSRAALAEAQFADDGGPVRLYWTADDQLVLWVEGAGAWLIPPDGGDPAPTDGELPLLWSPDGRNRITLAWEDGTTVLQLTDDDGDVTARTSAVGLVSHVRWSPDGERIVFTLGRSASGGGILQDLFLWDLGDGEAPMQLTSTGAAFGAEWLGSQPRWTP